MNEALHLATRSVAGWVLRMIRRETGREGPQSAAGRSLGSPRPLDGPIGDYGPAIKPLIRGPQISATTLWAQLAICKKRYIRQCARSL